MSKISLYENDLGKEYLNYCQLKEIALNTGNLDLSDIEWFFPTCLLPLGIFIKENQEIHVISPTRPEVSNYINIIMKGKIDSSKKSYIPIIEIPPDVKLREKILEPLISNQNAYVGGQNAFSYFIGELIDNIYEHSKFSIAYVMAQRYNKMKFTEVCIIDNGISIPGSYKNKGYKFNDIEALKEAVLKGLSTKSDERGYGLRTTLNLLTNGLEANCLIISGSASLIANKDNNKFHDIEKSIFNGTLISVRIPYKLSKVNIYEYIE
ncbi:MAG: hypothetical protein ACTSRC_13445 [Candidatus Helarchaeota archaeon]